jgi:hypothetical protein
MKRGVLASVILWGAVAIALFNFFVFPLVVEGYRSDPLITYAFMGLAGAMAGVKGLMQGVLDRTSDSPKKDQGKGPE